MITVLYVDDESTLLDIGKLFLERQGDFVIETETSPYRALDRISREPFDVIVSDYQMPDMDGIEFLIHLRSQNNTIPFIIFTGRGREEIAVQALKEGADFYLQKGGDPKSQFAELSNQIRQVFRQRKAEAELIRNEQKYRTLFETAQDSILLMDKARIIDCNRRTEEVFSCAKTEVIGKKFTEFILFDPDEDSSDKKGGETIGHALEGEPQFFDGIIIRGDKSRIDAEISLNRIDIPGEKILLAIVRDITARIKTEEELRHKSEELEASYEELIGIEEEVRAQYLKLSENEQALRESEENFRSILASIEDMVFTIDKNGIFREAFREGNENYFVSPESLLNRPYRDSLPELMANRLESVIENARDTGKTGTIEYHIDKNNSRHYFSALVSPRYDGDSNYSGVIVVARDVTRQKENEIALRENEAKLTTIINELPMALFMIDSNHKVVRWNRSMEKYSRISSEEIIGTDNHWKAFYSTKRPCLADIMLDREENEIPRWYDKKYTRNHTTGGTYEISDFFPTLGKDGIWLTAVASVIRDKEGEIIGAVEIFEDITEKKRAEEALIMSEQKFRLLINNATDMITIHQITKDGQPREFIEVNDIASKRLGYSREELLKISFQELEDKYPEEQAKASIKKLISQGREIYETVLRTKSNEKIPVEISAHISEVFGQMMVLSIIRDISGRKRYEEAIQNANKKLNLLSQITRHDILNQLTILNGTIDILDETITDPDQKNLLRKEQKVADTISRQITFTRDYQNVGVQSPLWQNLKKAITNAINLLETGDVKIDIDLGNTEVYADPLLEKVFFNLVDNALKYGVNLSWISFSLVNAENGKIIVCEDNGGGIPEKEKENIFNRKYYSNTGFGLFLSREILSITNLSINENGTFGKGARFEIFLPKGTYRDGAER